MPDVMEKIDFVMFADTGSENPETYEYMEKYIKPHLASINKQLVIVRGEEMVKGNLELKCVQTPILAGFLCRRCPYR